MTVAVIDRVVRYATIFEMNVESYRRRATLERKRGQPSRNQDGMPVALAQLRCRLPFWS
jgi:hypothetical protein